MMILIMVTLLLCPCSTQGLSPSSSSSMSPPIATELSSVDFYEIPGGTFQMGTDASTPLHVNVSGGQGNRLTGCADERPVQTHTVKPFEMMATEVTNNVYEQYDPSHRTLRGKLNFSYNDDEAVIWVSWDNATAFAKWMTQTQNDGYTYRLPTETEWEYACRAGTHTAYNTGDEFPTWQQRYNPIIGTKSNPEADWPNGNNKGPVLKLSNLTVGLFPPNAWHLHDMHGNVEEWTSSRYGVYGDTTSNSEYFVSRGGSHGTPAYFLRSSARFGAVRFASNWILGFRVVRAKTSPNDISNNKGMYNNTNNTTRHDVTGNENFGTPSLNGNASSHDVRTSSFNTKVPRPSVAPTSTSQPYFRGPLKYVNIPYIHNASFPFGHHNHDPAITHCPDGSMLAAWFSTWSEPDRECGLTYSRLQTPSTGTWSTPKTFYNTPARLNTGPAFMWVENNTKLLHWVATAPAGTWGGVVVYQRETLDCGITWSDTILPRGLDVHKYHSPAETAIVLSDGTYLLPTDDEGVLPTPHGSIAPPTTGQISRFYLSHDRGSSWVPSPAAIRGHHGAFVELKNGSLWGVGRNNGIVGTDGLNRMAQGLTHDRGATFMTSATVLPNVHGGQRMVALRLVEGPIIVVSFANGKSVGVPAVVIDGEEVFGLFVALSEDDANTFSTYRLISDDAKVSHPVETSDGKIFMMNTTHAETEGYISAIQDPLSRVVHVITSREHYQFNLAWIHSHASKD